MADGFGKIDFEMACRLGELTHNETRVLVYLYACRNEKTGQCNPRRKTIASDTGIEKGNVSRAIAGLEEKHWILENSDGHFYLFQAADIPPKVVKSTTKKVVKVTTKVVRSTTKSCQTNNSHNKELNREGTEKEQRKRTTDVVPKNRPFPEDFCVTDSMREWFDSKGYTFDIAEETEKFQNYHTSKGSKFSKWDAAWRTWMMRVKPTTQQKPKSISATADMLSPDYAAPKKERTFEEVVYICYDINKTKETLENFEQTKAEFLKLYPNKQSQIEDYERSELFRQRFSQSEPKQLGGGAIENGRGRLATQNQMPLSP